MTSIERACYAAALTACLLSGGCSLSPVPNPTQPSGVTQQLLMRSLERALAQLDIERLQRQTITIEVFLHAGPEVLIKEFVTTWLRAHGVRVVEGLPDLKVKAFASVLGTDTDQSLFGIPAFQRAGRERSGTGDRLLQVAAQTVLIFFGYTETETDKHD